MKLEKHVELLVERARKWLNERVAMLSWGQKRAILVVLDFFLLSFAVWLAFSIRLAHWVSPTPHQWAAIFLAPVVAIPIFVRMGLYRSVIRYLPERAFWTIARAAVLAVVVWIGVIFLFELARVTLIPRSIVFVYGMLAVALVAGSRFGIKLILRAPLMGMSNNRKVILYGAGRTGVVIAEALRREHSASIVAFVDDNPDLSERDIAGTRVYPAAQIKELMEQTGTTEVVLCMPSISSSRRAEIVSLLTGLHAKVRVVPAVSDLVTGRYIITQMREIDIDDLLGRSAVPAGEDLMRETIENKSILVTGGGGSIGSELCRLFVKWKPRELIILEQSEFALYEIDRQLRRVSSVPIVPVLGSATNRPLVEQTLRRHAVQVVFHAAAHKHVPMVEANAIEGIRNNVFGTQVVVSSSFDAGVERFVLISTDKAVRPSNVMGATKRAAEMITREFAERAIAQGRQQKFCAVRFGNVLGSTARSCPCSRNRLPPVVR